MNRIYRLIWNRRLHTLQVASDIERPLGGGAAALGGSPLRKHPLALAGAAAIALGAFALPAWSLPTCPGGATQWSSVLATSGTPGSSSKPAGNGSDAQGGVTAGGYCLPAGNLLIGGAGGTGAPNGGHGGAGGAGVHGTGFTLTDIGNISGGGGGDGVNAIAGSGGTGGVGGVAVTGAGFTLLNDGPTTGGAGGNGGAGSNGATGGAGGQGGNGGITISAINSVLSNDVNIVGGNGGTGGTGGNSNTLGVSGGAGGAGGNGAAAVNGADFSLTNAGSIAGGNGGGGGSGGTGHSASNGPLPGQNGSGGTGAAGIVTAGGASIVNYGRIVGGLSSDGATQADAVDFSGGGNTLTLEVGSSETGRIVSTSGSANGGDTLILGDNPNDGTSDSLDNDTVSGFASYAKTGTSTWTLTGTQALQTGTLAVAGGTLAVDTDGIQVGGVVTIDPSATLNLALAGASGASTVGTLAQNGTLDLGNNSIIVSSDYTNANFGSGNSFNRRAGVTGSGEILAVGNVAQAITGADVTNGTTANPTLAFGIVHVGTGASTTYAIGNTGTSGPSLRGAIQTSVNGGNLTDASLSGSGVTAQNYGPVSTGASTAAYTVDWAPTVAGTLTSQAVHIANNFANVGEQTMAITGTAYDYANFAFSFGGGLGKLLYDPITNRYTLELDNLLQNSYGGTTGTTLAFVNNAPVGAYTDLLSASPGVVSGPGFYLTGDSVSNLAGGAVQGGFGIGLSTLSTGIFSELLSFNVDSIDPGSTTSLPDVTLDLKWTVAAGSVSPVPEPGSLGMLGAGLAMLGGFIAFDRRRRIRNPQRE